MPYWPVVTLALMHDLPAFSMKESLRWFGEREPGEPPLGKPLVGDLRVSARPVERSLTAPSRLGELLSARGDASLGPGGSLPSSSSWGTEVGWIESWILIRRYHTPH